MNKVSAFFVSVLAASAVLATPAMATAEPDIRWSASVNDKANAPATNLKEYPKVKLAKGPKPASIGKMDHKEVIVKSANKIDRYTPAPGWTPEQLVEKLKSEGKNAELTSEDVSIMASPSDCSYGYAWTYLCPNATWPNRGASDPQIYFNDHTSAAWPVTTGVWQWNQAVGIDSYYGFNTCGPYPTTTACIHVYSANYGHTGWAGYTSYTTVPYGGEIRFNTVTVSLNDYSANTPALKKGITCHELGHALGVGHSNRAASCTTQYWWDSTLAPHSDDYNLLGLVLYSVYRTP